MSDETLALVNAGENCAFELYPLPGNQGDITSAYQGCGDAWAEKTEIIELSPNEERSFEFDFNQPRWHVNHNGEILALIRLGPRDRIRLIYRAPEASVLAQLSAEKAIWVGYLPSRAFNASGIVD